MRRFLKKFLPVLLLPVLLLLACAQEYDHDFSEPTDTTVQSSPICQHVFVTTVANEYGDITETHHSCYEVETSECTNCGFQKKSDLIFLYTEYHELAVVERYEVNENGEFIFYGICADCDGSGRTVP